MAYSAVQLKKHMESVSQSHKHPRLGTIWVPVRPYGKDNFMRRLKDAWHVLIGKYDALDWTIPD